ncbi:MAG: hypothetical protein WCT10_04315 [Patescibacteria group bacterium]|jgi:hypothetical protein
MSKMTCEMLFSITDVSLQQELWRVYLAAFQPSSELCIQEQLCYSEESFRSALTDPDYVKFVAKEDGHAIGLHMGTNNLEKARVAYVNPRKLEAQFPEFVGRIYYFTIFAIEPSRQGSECASLIVTNVGLFIEQHDAIVAFDYASEKNSRLPQLIIHVLEVAHSHNLIASDTFTGTPLGGQCYYAIRVSKSKK